MQTGNVRYFCLFLILLIFVGCTDANPKVSILRALDNFDFQRSFIITANMNSVPLQARCSKFIDQVDVSFDGGVTWVNTATYDPSVQSCSTGAYSVTMSSSKAPWNSITFTNGEVVNLKFRARSRAGMIVYRDVSVKFTPSATVHQEALVGTASAHSASMNLKSRLRGQQQRTAASTTYILRGRILE